jgi:hypothetical protein
MEDGNTFDTLDSTMPSSEMTSEISLDSEQVKVSLDIVSPFSQSHSLRSVILTSPQTYQSGSKLTTSYVIRPDYVLLN